MTVVGIFPKVLGDNADLAPVNEALHKTLVRAETAFAHHTLVEPNLTNFKGRYGMAIDRTLISAGPHLISGLVREYWILPGENDEPSLFVAFSISVPGGKAVNLLDRIFSDRAHATHTLHTYAIKSLKASHSCFALASEGDTVDPEVANYETMALTPSGLSVGFFAGAGGCSSAVVTVPYRVVEPELNAYGRLLRNGAMKPTFSTLPKSDLVSGPYYA